jgi:hypothetical protein
MTEAMCPITVTVDGTEHRGAWSPLGRVTGLSPLTTAPRRLGGELRGSPRVCT